MKVLDTTFLIDLLRGRDETLQLANSKDVLLTTQINMYEIIRGFFIQSISSSKFVEIMELFDQIRVLGLDDNAVVKSAEISADLIKKGAIISDCDCFTAGIALSNNISIVVTNNTAHFKRIPGITVETY